MLVLKKIAILCSIFFAFSCNTKSKEYAPIGKDNDELFNLYFNDQEDRMIDYIEWDYVHKRDSLRRVRVHQLIDSNRIRTSKDYKNAAMIFQHGKDSTDYGLAVRLISKSIELDSTQHKWLFAATTDRYLLSKGKPQIYGTQYKRNWDEPWRLAKIDTTKISDEERVKFGVETLVEQQEKVKLLNEKLNKKNKKDYD